MFRIGINYYIRSRIYILPFSCSKVENVGKLILALPLKAFQYVTLHLISDIKPLKTTKSTIISLPITRLW